MTTIPHPEPVREQVHPATLAAAFVSPITTDEYEALALARHGATLREMEERTGE